MARSQKRWYAFCSDGWRGQFTASATGGILEQYLGDHPRGDWCVVIDRENLTGCTILYGDITPEELAAVWNEFMEGLDI